MFINCVYLGQNCLYPTVYNIVDCRSGSTL